jgi:hypothetical protein
MKLDGVYTNPSLAKFGVDDKLLEIIRNLININITGRRARFSAPQVCIALVTHTIVHRNLTR